MISSRYSKTLFTKPTIMQAPNTILSLTTDLLAHHAFGHLKDDEISSLHHLILKLKEPLTTVQENLLLTFWNHAHTTHLPAALLHRCNMILLQLGRSPLEETAFETAYFD